MRMGSSWNDDKRGTGVWKTALFAVTEPGAAFALSNMNCVANKARIRDSRTERSTNYSQTSRFDNLLDVGSLFDGFASRLEINWAGKFGGVG